MKIPDHYELATYAAKCQLDIGCRGFYMARPMTTLALKVMLNEGLRCVAGKDCVNLRRAIRGRLEIPRRGPRVRNAATQPICQVAASTVLVEHTKA